MVRSASQAQQLLTQRKIKIPDLNSDVGSIKARRRKSPIESTRKEKHGRAQRNGR